MYIHYILHYIVTTVQHIDYFLHFNSATMAFSIAELKYECILCFSVKVALAWGVLHHLAFLGFCLVQPPASMDLWVLTALPPQVRHVPLLVLHVAFG